VGDKAIRWIFMKTPQKAGSTTTDAGTPSVHCAHDEMVDVVDLIPNPRNPNKHSDKQVALLAKIIRHQGWRAPIVVSKRSGFVVAGHGRLDAAKLMGVQLVPVNRQEFATEADEWAHLIADNRIAELADMDNSALGDLLKELDGLDFDLEAAGFDEKAADLLTATESDVDAEPQVDKAAELQKKWNTATGQLWQLGDHRLICGDCTDAKTVARVMGGEKAQMMVTDPPYGVEYDPTWRVEAGVSKGSNRMGKVVNDDNADWSAAWRNFDGDIAYVYHAGCMSSVVQASLEQCGFKIRAQIVWAKDRMALSRGDYHWQHEPVWYAVREGKTGLRTEDRTQTTLWTIPARDDAGHGHGTQKPVECMERPIRNHTCDIIYEPFSGSGTTIIACERLGRKCRAIEISPAYVAVALQRWADATGKTPELLA
jgi:DNA modification methylase